MRYATADIVRFLDHAATNVARTIELVAGFPGHLSTLTPRAPQMQAFQIGRHKDVSSKTSLLENVSNC